MMIKPWSLIGRQWLGFWPLHTVPLFCHPRFVEDSRNGLVVFSCVGPRGSEVEGSVVISRGPRMRTMGPLIACQKGRMLWPRCLYISETGPVSKADMLPFQDPFQYTVVLSGIPIFPIFSLPGPKISSLLSKSLCHLFPRFLPEGQEGFVIKNEGSKVLSMWVSGARNWSNRNESFRWTLVTLGVLG